MSKVKEENKMVRGKFNGDDELSYDKDGGEYKFIRGKEYEIELCDCMGSEYGYVEEVYVDCKMVEGGGHVKLSEFLIFDNNMSARQKQGLV